MSKPEDIPDKVWRDAGYHICGDATLMTADAFQEATARAILAAVEEERSAVLDAAHTYLMQQYGYGMLSHPVDRERVLAIRNRS